MGRMFIGMIIGSLITMSLLGGSTAADRLLSQAKITFAQQYTHPDPITTLVLLTFLGLSLAVMAASRTKLMRQNAVVVKKLRRFCT